MPGPLFPLGGITGVFDAKQPTLVPNFDISYAAGQSVDHASPYAYVNGNNTYGSAITRADATATVTFTGSVTTSDTVSLTIGNAVFAGARYGTLQPAQIVHTYTTIASDSLSSVASNLANLFNDDVLAQMAGVRLDVGGTSGQVLTVRWNGPLGNLTTIAYANNGGTELGALSAGVLAGGTGPIIPMANFVWTGGGGTNPFWYGIPRSIGYDTMLAMAQQGMSIA